MLLFALHHLSFYSVAWSFWSLLLCSVTFIAMSVRMEAVMGEWMPKAFIIQIKIHSFRG